MPGPVYLVDVGTGNLRSVQKALEHCGAEVVRTDNADTISTASRLVLPGVGAFGDFMRGLKEKGLDKAIKQAVKTDAYLMGICVGMQALFEWGEEMGQHEGLGLVPGVVRHLPISIGLKFPQTGWNQVHFQAPHPIAKHFSAPEYFYFNHAYACYPSEPGNIIACTTYGATYASAISTGRITAVQFHPEKSQASGLQLLSNFLELSR